MNTDFSFRNGIYSRLLYTRSFIIIFLLLILLGLHLTISLSLGGRLSLSIEQIFHGLQEQEVILFDFRLPRIFLAIITGGALAVSGLILQTVIKNPLASPDILAITPGASVSAIIFISYLKSYLSIYWLPIFAMGGAYLSVLLIFLIVKKGSLSSMYLVLTGIALSSLLAAVTTFLLYTSPVSSTMFAYVWLSGSVYGATWNDVRDVVLWTVPILPWLWIQARHVHLNSLDNTSMQGLGANVSSNRIFSIVIATALAAISVAYAGGLPFVGLVAPHIARQLVTQRFSDLAITSALIGAHLVLFADLIGRTLFLPLDLPAGIFVAAMGAPFFVYLLIGRKHD